MYDRKAVEKGTRSLFFNFLSPMKTALQQVEFYFSDSNYLKDKFLLSTAKQTPEGWISLDVINSFNRMKSFNLTTPELAEQLKDSTVVALSEDKTKVRRVAPLPEKDTSEERSVRVKPVPEDSTIESVEELLSKYGTIQCVRLRRNFHTQKYDSAIVEFSTVEEAKSFLDQELDFEAKTEYAPDYFKRKAEQREQRTSKRREAKQDAKTDKKSLEDEEEDEGVEFVEGCLLEIKNLPATCTREILTELLSPFATVGYVAYSQGEPSAKIRFSDVAEEKVAQKVADKLQEDSIKIGGQTPELVVLTGADEAMFYIEAKEKKAALRKNRKGRGGPRKRGRRN
ncbi:hypothetical protein GEMRC1_003671 [Eukaryota sp. GEM-RC1]